MRTLSSTLLAAQKSGAMTPLWKVVLTHSSPPAGQAASYTYTFSRVIEIKEHTEEQFSQKATLVMDNSDGTLTSIDLKGYKAVISYGATTSAGDEYSPCAPLWVIGQSITTSPGALNCILACIGTPDLLAEDQASSNIIPTQTGDEGWNETVKTWIAAILGATRTCFSHCTAYTVTWDSEDSLIDVFKPNDGFRIYVGGSRLAAVRRLLDYTKCVMRVEDDGNVHIFVPTITGTTYDYEYKWNVSGEHPFFAEAYKSAAVIPNYIVVQTLEDAAVAYSGYASVADKIGVIRAYYLASVASNAQATTVAEAILSKIQLNSEIGRAETLIMNVGAEMGDYVKVTNSLSSQNRTGNVGSLTRHAKAGKNGKFSLSFSFGGQINSRSVENLLATYSDKYANVGRLSVKDLQVEKIQAASIDLTTLDQDDIQDGTTYGRILNTHINAGGVSISALTTFAADYNPTEKFDLGDDTLDAIANGATFSRVQTAALTAGGLVLADQIDVSGTYGLLRNTNISAGNIKLTADAVMVGKWYNSSGVLIDASFGMHIYGSASAFTTSGAGTAITAFADAGGGEVTVTSAGHGLVTGDSVRIWGTTSYNGTFTVTVLSSTQFKITDTWVANDATGTVALIQAYVGSNGAITAGAGAVVLDASGLLIKGATALHILDATETYGGFIFADNTGAGNLWVDCLVGQLRLATVDGHIYMVPGGAGKYAYISNLSSGTQIISTLAGGTAPFSITSTTVCTNLNADLLDGSHASAFSLTSHGHAATDISWARWSMDLDPDSSVGGYHLGDATYYWGDGYINALRVNTLYARTGTVIQVSGAGTYSIGDASNYPSVVIGGYFWGNVFPWTDSTGSCGSDSYTWADCWAVTFHDVSPHKPANFKALEALRAVKFRPDGGYDKTTLPDYCVYRNPNKHLDDTQITQRLAGMGMKDPKPPYNRRDGTDLGAMIQFNLLTNMELIELVESLQARVEALEVG